MKTIILTAGDPNGVGPECIVRTLVDIFSSPGSKTPRPNKNRIIVVGASDPLLSMAGDSLFSPLSDLNVAQGLPAGVYLHTPGRIRDFTPTLGEETTAGGLAAGVCLDAAMPLLLTGRAQALVTAPLSKKALNAAGFSFPGHTEFLAERSGLKPDEVCMYFHTPKLKVGLVTTHLPLERVPAAITEEKILRALRLTCEAAAKSSCRPGPVAVCGLNPHAGEGGLLGREDDEIIAPAVARARMEGMDATGPLPADTVFHQAMLGVYSAVLAMYHDQGLAPLKLLYFRQAVNVTLGLPFVRTSPAHGTAYALAGKGTADFRSFREAFKLALKLLRA